MSAFAESSFNSQDYNSFRPTYPDGLYETIINYHKGDRGLAVDIGCGSGQATYPLARYFDKVIGTDISQVMIDTATNRLTDEFKNKIEFHQSPAETLSFIEDNSIDFVAAAECIHWFDHPAFFKEISRILKPNGTLAFWAYCDVNFDTKEADHLSEEFTYEDPNQLGPYWQQPGRQFLRTLFDGIEAPTDLFKDIIVYEYRPNDSAKQKFPFKIHKTMPLSSYADYVRTWSAYHSWKKEHQNEKDIIQVYLDTLNEKFGWTAETQINLRFRTILKLSRKK